MRNHLGLGLVVGACLGYSLARAPSASRGTPHLNAWRDMLEERLGEVRAAVLVARVRARYADLFGQRPRLRNRVLMGHLEANLLPGLALYQVLLESGGGREAALGEATTLISEAIARGDTLMARLASVANPFGEFRQAIRRELASAFPPAGWRVEMVEDSGSTFAFNMHRCFCLELLGAYGAQELTAAYCACDDRVYTRLPPSIVFTRTGTLAQGASLCDFRWDNRLPDLAEATGERAL